MKNLLELGLTNGFSLCYDGLRVHTKAAMDNPIIVSQKINKAIRLRRTAGPFKTIHFPNLKYHHYVWCQKQPEKKEQGKYYSSPVLSTGFFN